MPKVSCGVNRGLENYDLQSVHADPMRDYGHFFPVLPPKFDINSLSEAWLSFAGEVGLPSEEAFDVLFSVEMDRVAAGGLMTCSRSSS